jgi:hypothetical protein
MSLDRDLDNISGPRFSTNPKGSLQNTCASKFHLLFTVTGKMHYEMVTKSVLALTLN